MATARCSSVALMLLLTCCSAASAGAADEKLTHLHFYFHEVEAGAPNATVVNVASLHKNASTFGDLNVFDNALREGPDPASRLIGRAQGIGVHASLDESGGLTTINFVFSDYGEYSGSTLATTGHFIVSGPSERSIVGGTGKLRFARGYLTSKLLSSNSKDASIVVVFDMSALSFGDVNVFDNPLREGLDPASRLIGRAQGMVVRASLDDSSVFAAINFVFSGDHGEYSGSTLATQGHFDASGAPSERSIVGGTGRLRFARGYMRSRLHSSTDTSIVVVFDMHFTLPH